MPSSKDQKDQLQHSVLDAWGELTGDEIRVPDAPILHHYTDAYGLHGIISNHELWATAAQFSNDLSEIDYAVKVALNVVDEIWGKKKNLSQWEELLLQHVQRIFGTPLHTFGQPFITCFCENGDLLSQWRGYGKDCGFALAFEPIVRDESCKLDCIGGTRTVVRKINYEPAAQRKTLRKSLEKFITLVNGFKDSPESEKGHLAHLELSILLILDLTDWACAVKHNAFAAEQEWRIITYPKSAAMGIKPEKYDGVFVTPSSKFLRPYMKLKDPSKGRLPLVEIRCGPSPLQEQSSRALQILLRNHGYKNIPITLSEVPLRI
jgi:hypothetical protein